MAGGVWMWLVITMVVAVVLGLGIGRSTKRVLKLPPGPRVWPLIGCLASLPSGHSPEVMFAKLAEKHGELMLLWLGSKPYVVVSSARMAMEFLKTHDQEFANRPMSVVRDYVSFKGNSIISMSASDPKYQRLRRTFVMELLSAKKISASRDLRKGQILKSLRAIREDLDAKHEANFTEAILTLGMSISICLLFGRDYGDKVFPEEIQTLVLTFKTMVKYLSMINISDLIPSLRWLDLQGIEANLRLLEIQLRKSIMVLIEQKRLVTSGFSLNEIDGGAYERDILSKLLSLEGEDHLDDDQLMGVVFALLLAGSDSISKGIGRAMQELLKQPLLHQRALDELDEVVGRKRLVEESDISSLPFINNIIKETLRLHPPGQLLIPHGNIEECEVAGYRIPARSTVLVNLYSMSRDPSFWDSPLKFDPDRFVDSNLTVQGNDFHYIPFGYGRRGCPGLNLGMITLQYAFALCLQCIHWRLPAGATISDIYIDWKNTPDLIIAGDLRVDPQLLERPSDG